MSDSDFTPEGEQWQADRAKFQAETDAAVRGYSRHAVKTGITLLVLAIIAGALYLTGWLNRGAEKRHIVWNSGFSSSGAGFSMGPKGFYLRAGQTFIANYNVTINRGEFYLWLRRKTLGLEMPIAGEVRLKSSGQGVLQVPIQQSGFYRVTMDGSPGGNGYDVDYHVSWHVQ